jgi:hypothetical protein
MVPSRHFSQGPKVMTTVEALTSVTQTLLRMRAPNWIDAYNLGDIARATAECASLVNADASDQNAAIVELWRRRR